jgi:hypothetical protein
LFHAVAKTGRNPNVIEDKEKIAENDGTLEHFSTFKSSAERGKIERE